MNRAWIALGLCCALAACGGGDAHAPSTTASAGPVGAGAHAYSVSAAPSASVALEPSGETGTPAEAALPAASDAAIRAELARSAARVRELEALVQKLRDDRVAREREWLEYTRSIARLSTIAELESARFQPAPDPDGAPAVPATGELQAPPPLVPPDPERVRAARERDAALLTSLRALFLSEQVSGLELLEAGRLQGDALGPVVLRMRDDLGRTVGTLCAERMHLEASFSARSVTLVLEDGYERRGGERIPFPAASAAPARPEAAERTSTSKGAEPDGGPTSGDIAATGAAPAPPVQAADAAAAGTAPDTEAPAEAPIAPMLRSGRRRIELPHVDPRPWVEAVPELFRPVDKEPIPDDGRWDLLALRAAMNLLLRQDGAGGTWRLKGLAGVQEGVLRDVQFDHVDREGRLEKKLFADRLVVRAEDHGVRLEFESGSVLRGDSMTPFLDGRYRIFLPRADVAEWRSAGVPGLSEPPPRRKR